MKMKQAAAGLALAAALVLPASAANVLSVNGQNLWTQAQARLVEEDTTYVSLRAVVNVLAPDAAVTWEDGTAWVRGTGLTLSARPGEQWLTVNGRALYIPHGVRLERGSTLVPIRALAKDLKISVITTQRAYDELGLPFDPRRCEPCRYSLPDAYDTTKRLLARCPELTALFCISDVMAMGAIRAIRDLGRRVPEDVSVVGYDGIPLSQFSVPRLATVRQDTQLLAEQGVELLLRGIQRPCPPVHNVVPFQLISGGSVASPRTA